MGTKREVLSGTEFPTTTHQRVTGWLFTEIAVYLRQRQAECQAIASPFAVFLGEEEDSYFKPDITVVGDGGKLDDEGCHGAPDWVVEVVSPDSRAFDYGGKLAAYIEAGVREYWIVDPEKQIIVAYYLEKPDVPAIYYFGDIVKSDIYEGLEMDTSPLIDIRYEGKGTDRQGTARQGTARDLSATGRGESTKDTGTPGDTQSEGIGGRGMEQTENNGVGIHSEEILNTVSRGRDETEAMSVEEVKAYMSENFADLVSSRNRGQMMKAAISVLKGKADSRTLSEAVAQLSRG